MHEDYEELVGKEKKLKAKLKNEKSKYNLDEFEDLTMEFTEKLERYLKEKVLGEVKSMSLEPKLKKELESAGGIINFNYTNVDEKYGINSNVLSIHGNLEKGQNPVIGYYYNVKEVYQDDDYRKKYSDRIFSKETIFDRIHREELVPLVEDFFETSEPKI